jgi:outer membrane protein OmpA-like peptidoglycan-associated protein
VPKLPAAPYQGLSLGLGAGVNTITLSEEGLRFGAVLSPEEGDIGLGAMVAVEGRLNRFFALDFHGRVTTLRSRFAALGTDDTFLGLEALLYLRFYPFAPKEMGRGGVEFFLGAGGGVFAMMNGLDFRNSRGSPEACGITGFRFRLGKHFYIELYARGSYHPRLFGAGLAAGFRFPARPAPGTVAGGEEPAGLSMNLLNALSEVFLITFQPSSARFNDLDAALVLKNEETLTRVIALLDEYPDARLLIEGYANPVLGTDDEKPTLLSLSERRAASIARALSDAGVSPERLVPVGEGGLRPIVPIEDRSNWDQNRRVELRLIPPPPPAAHEENGEENGKENEANRAD